MAYRVTPCLPRAEITFHGRSSGHIYYMADGFKVITVPGWRCDLEARGSLTHEVSQFIEDRQSPWVIEIGNKFYRSLRKACHKKIRFRIPVVIREHLAPLDSELPLHWNVIISRNGKSLEGLRLVDRVWVSPTRTRCCRWVQRKHWQLLRRTVAIRRKIIRQLLGNRTCESRIVAIVILVINSLYQTPHLQVPAEADPAGFLCNIDALGMISEIHE